MIEPPGRMKGERLSALRAIAVPILGMALFVVALWVLDRELSQYHYHDVLASLRAVPRGRITIAIALTVANYWVLTGYDTLALRYIGHPLSYARIAMTSFVAYAFSQNLGFSVVTGGTVRFRLYSSWGLSASEITHAVVFSSATFFLGLGTVGGLAFLLDPLPMPAMAHLPFATVRPLGVLCLAAVGGYVLAGSGRRTVRVKGWEFGLPGPKAAALQIALASLDWALAGAVLYAILPAGAVTFPSFLSIFLLGQLLGVISGVPGGLGIFEAVLLLFLTPAIAPDALAASLVLFRIVYYVVPLIAAAALLAWHEISSRSEKVRLAARLFGRSVPMLAPQVLAVSTFIAGAILLVSGATPALTGRLAWLNELLPLPVIEASHFLGSIVGASLLVLAWGIQRRLDGAWVLTVAMLAAGIAFSLLKGLDYEEALALTAMLAALLPARREFHRRTSLTAESFTPGWLLAVMLVVIASVWIGVFSNKHVAFAGDMWWRFALAGDAPRFLRATAGAIGALIVFSVARLLRPASPEPSIPGTTELEHAKRIIDASSDPGGNLALVGDKTLLFDEAGNAFVMYAVEGRSWVAMGDPVGPDDAREELAWRFVELADRHHGWPVFYQVRHDNLPLYLDLGLALSKLGEQARVPLEGFTLEGSRRKMMRQLVRRMEREGVRFDILPAGECDGGEELREISDAWLAGKSAREKSFSLGRFDPEYLRHFPVAVAREEDRIIAFTNLWTTADRSELSVDLMRFRPDARAGVMEYLFIELMTWGRDNGFAWFDLGMAPLAGLESRPLAPLWNRLGATVFRHGEHFYNFQGLRQYKQKFDPVWQPRYLASPGGLALPRVLTNIATLIAGGLGGVVRK